METEKIITTLILVSLLSTVIGSWIIFEKVTNMNTQDSAPTANTNVAILRDSGKVTMTILAPSGPRNIDSAQASIKING